MKITFIKPSMNGKRSYDALEPLAILILYSLTPGRMDVDFYDERTETLPIQMDSDAIVFSVETFTAKRTYLLAKKYKTQNPAVKIIMGGFHVTACPEEAAEFADSIIIGDAEGAWEKVVDDLGNHCLRPRYISENPYILPFERMKKEIYKEKKYRKVGIVQWKRGCVYHCNFCSIHAYYKSRILQRDVDDVINEIRHMKHKLVFIADDNLLYDKEKLKEFLIKLTPLKKHWVCQISINVADDGELLRLMAKSGCKVMIIGFETLDVENLKAIGKVSNLKNLDYEKQIQNIYKYGIMIYATFIFGYPNDTEDTFQTVYRFAMKNKFFIVNFNPLMALPATALYGELKEKGSLVDEKWWLSDGYYYGKAMHNPENLTTEQLMRHCRRIRYRVYSFWGMVKRLSWLSIRNFPIYFIMNVVSAIEIRRKQQSRLGVDE